MYSKLVIAAVLLMAVMCSAYPMPDAYADPEPHRYGGGGGFGGGGFGGGGFGGFGGFGGGGHGFGGGHGGYGGYNRPRPVISLSFGGGHGGGKYGYRRG